MEKKSYIISIVALVVSIITLILFFFRVSPNSVVDSNTFISVLVAIIAISVTILVGYQIYNVMELKQSISEYDKLKEEMKETKSKIEYISIEQNEGFHIIQSRLYSNSINKIDSLLHCVYAIKYSLSVNHKENGYKWLLEQLEKCMLSITLTSFWLNFSNSSQITDGIEAQLKFPTFDKVSLKTLSTSMLALAAMFSNIILFACWKI